MIAKNKKWNSSLIFDVQLGIIATKISGEECISVPSPAPIKRMDIFCLTEMIGSIVVFSSNSYATSEKVGWKVLKKDIK